MTTYYLETGQGVPVALIHGVGPDHGMWNAQVDFLKEHYRVVRYDMLGHGQSCKPAVPYTLALFEQQLRALLDVFIARELNIYVKFCCFISVRVRVKKPVFRVPESGIGNGQSNVKIKRRMTLPKGETGIATVTHERESVFRISLGTSASSA